MKKMLWIALVCVSSLHAMSNEEYERMYFTKPMWSGIVLYVRRAHSQSVLDEYLRRIRAITTDLHARDEHRHYLLGELLSEAISDECYKYTGSLEMALKKCRDNCAYILRQLIQSGAINITASNYGRIVCDALDNDYNKVPGHHAEQLQQFCAQRGNQ